MSDKPDRKQNTDATRDALAGDRKRREISGPGAADFLTAPGGLDLPETDPAKGTRAARTDDAAIIGGDAEGLAPQLDERTIETERRWEGGGGDRKERAARGSDEKPDA